MVGNSEGYVCREHNDNIPNKTACVSMMTHIWCQTSRYQDITHIDQWGKMHNYCGYANVNEDEFSTMIIYSSQ